MKKILALLLAVIMCAGVFAACGDEKEPAVDNTDKTDGAGKTDETDKPKETQIKVTFDMTDTYTLVIETLNVETIRRTGVRCEPGKVQVGKYNPTGRRTKGYEFDWASLGLEGKPWEYLGSECEIDITDEANPVMLTKPVKSVWCVKATDVTFPDTKTLQIPDGTTFELKIMNYGGLRQNLLFNEGGQFVPNWNWAKNCNSPTDTLYTSDSYNYGYYVIIKVPQYGKNFITDVPADLNVNDGLEDVDVIPAMPTGAIGTQYVVVANDQRSLGTAQPTFKNAIRVVVREQYEAYLTGRYNETDVLNLNYTDTDNDYLGTVLLVNYSSVEEKIMGVYLTGEKITLPAA